MLSQEEAVGCAASAYIDNIYASEDVMPATHVREHLAQFVQGSGAVGGRRTGARIGGQDGTRRIAVEARKRSSRSSQCLYATNSILFVWATCRAPSGVRLASCGLRNTQEASKFSHEGLG